MQSNLTMIRALPLSSGNYNLLYNVLILLLVLTKYQYEGSGTQFASYLGLDIINNVCDLVIHHIVCLMIFALVMPAGVNVSFVKDLISVMTLGSVVTALLLLRFKLMNGF
jgi:hypothetical protein